MPGFAWAMLWLFLFTVPWEKSVWVPGAGSIAHAVGLAAFAAWAIVLLQRREVRRPNAALLLAALFVMWCAATSLWTLDPAASRGRVLTFCELFAMFVLIWDQCRTPARQIQLLAAYVCGAVAACGAAFWRYFHNQQTNYLRYAPSGFDPNDFGLVLALSVPLALYLALRARGRARWLWFASLPVTASAILLTASRTSLVATFVALTFALWTWRAGGRAYRIATVVLIAVLGLSLVRFAPAPQRKRLATITTEMTTGTFHGRTQIWKAGLKVLKQHPLLGVGSGAYPKAVTPWLGTPKLKGFQYVAHNSFLSVLVETGLIGFTIYALLLATLAIFVWCMPTPERALWTVVAAAWAVGVSTLTWEHYKPTWVMMALIATAWARAWAPPRTSPRTSPREPP